MGSFNQSKCFKKVVHNSNRNRLSIVASVLALSGLLSTAHAVEFFKDDFEGTSLNDTIGKAGQKQNTLTSGWDIYASTQAWTSGPNGIEIQANGIDGINAYSGKRRIELDTHANSSMTTKVNLVNGQAYNLNFQYRSRVITKTTTTKKCILFFCWPVTTTATSTVGGGVRAKVESPTYSTGFYQVGDVNNWTKGSTNFTYWGTSGEATITFEATGTSDGLGTLIDDIILGTTIEGSTAALSKAEALTGILPPHVPGLVSKDSNRSDIITPVVVNKQAAIALGKALFWDRAVGSDMMACASCHFNAGADNRLKNQFSPGLNRTGAATSTTFENTKSGKKSGPNYTVTQADFPFDPNNDDVMSSSGTFSGAYKTSQSDRDEDGCDRSVNGIFHVNGVGTRNVEPRNTPTVINAAFNHRNFWDGRANNEFNGVSPFGRRDQAAGVFISSASTVTKKPLKLRNSSLASQAVGPVGSDFEMACRGRQFADVGRKLLPRAPLRSQTIAADDSVLSTLPAGTTYAKLVQAAFAPEYWNGNCGSNCGKPGTGVLPATAYNQMEANFSMYFGLAVQLYTDTLVSDDAKFDKWKRGLVSASAEESRGESVFNGQGKCSSCHKGPTMTSAAIFQKHSENVVQGMLMKDGSKAVYDEGYYNISVVPTAYDIGNGGVDPWNNPLSFSRQYLSGNFVDKFSFDSCTFEEASADLCSSNDAASVKSQYRAAVDGAFKTPTLRNVALTGPYMHNGSLATLEQVVDFYNRGGNFGTDKNRDKHPDIQPLGLSPQQKSDLVAFLKTLTDDRVLYEKAPFDHPSLMVPNGHTGDQNQVTAGNPLFNKLGIDEVLTVPAVGRNGNSKPLKSFDEQLTGSTTTTANTSSVNIKVGHSARSIAAGSDGSVLVTNSSNNTLWKYSADNNWTQFPGAEAKAVAVVNANRTFHVGLNNAMWRTDNGGVNWYQVGNNANAIAASSDGMVIGTTTGNTIWTYNSNTNTYTNLPGLAKAVAIVNANTFFAIGLDNHVYRYNGWAWVFIGPDAGGIAASNDGTVLVSNIYNNSIWKYVSDNNWVNVPGTSKVNAVIANNRYFAIGTDGNVYRN